MKKRGWQVTGIEPSASLCQRALKKYNLKLVNKEFNYHDFKPKSFNLICLFDVLEHLENPAKMIKNISYLMKKDGKMLIKTRNIDSLTSKLSILSFILTIAAIKKPIG